MKKGCLIALGAFAVLVLVSIVSLTWVIVRKQAPSVDRGSYVELDLDGEIPENINEPSLLGEDPLTMQDIADILHWAGDDSRVAGVVLRIDGVDAGWAKIEEIRSYVEEVRGKGKKVIAFLEEGDDEEYYLATAADKIYMPPMGYLGVDGLSTEMEYYKGILDKVGVDYDGVAIGEYKSAPEHYKNVHMSDHEREEMQALLDGTYQHYVEAVAKARNLTVDQVNDLVNHGPYQAIAAKDKGLVDETFYWDEFEDWVKGTSSKKPDIVVADKLMAEARGKREPGALASSEVAVVYATGEIAQGDSADGGLDGDVMGSDTIVDALKDAKDDDSVKAVVLRIDSPGGDVLASDLIWREVQVVKASKPVIVSMSDLAASGGYYIAMGASEIVAEPGTITGSIGIFTGKFVTKGLYDKVGLSVDGVKKGTYSDMYSSTRDFNADERAKILADLQDSYQVFIKKVADGRGLDVKAVDAIGRGRVWLGTAGKDKGLVDKIGGLDVAIDEARKKANLSGSTGVVIFPKKKSIWDRLSDQKGIVGIFAPRTTSLPKGVDKLVRDGASAARLPDDGRPLMMLPYRIRIR